ncbi:hypothetical protein Zmor_016117 [Zophobas morio]|uniref:O-acyltransferase n=1 Tax=Zophobas morio TaxID=2755281 RepID=A0AA38IFL5_9CUCU|nr:hypothetical protein Zmor_016117 [Zophobas morio]
MYKKTHEKKFVLRNSLLTDIIENPQTRYVYNVYVIVFILLCVQNAATQYVKKGSVKLGLDTITIGFAKFDKAVLVWFCCLGATCGTFFCFQIWAKFRIFTSIYNLSGVRKMWDWFWITSLLSYYFYVLKLTSTATEYFGFNPPCAALVTLESVRLLMKVHSFVRNKAPAVLQPLEISPIVKFSNFFYFLFAPTLIYRDNYPRTNKINWKFVCRCFLECTSVLFTYSFVLEAAYPSPERLIQKYTLSELVMTIAEVVPYGTLVILGNFVLILHSVQNLFAEITRFGDRLFYSDWWNEHSFVTWLAKWNLLVRDWFYYYVYRDFKQHIYDSTSVAIFGVLLVSSMAHDYAMFCCFRRSSPLLVLITLFCFFLSFWCNFAKNMFSNVFVMCCIFIWGSLVLTLYGLEYYALTKYPLTNPTFFEILIPRIVTCDCLLKFN